VLSVYPQWVRPRIERALLDTPAVFVDGPWQSGKSTLVRLIWQDGYVTLDRATVVLEPGRILMGSSLACRFRWRSMRRSGFWIFCWR
jgi:hypothetical protein